MVIFQFHNTDVKASSWRFVAFLQILLQPQQTLYVWMVFWAQAIISVQELCILSKTHDQGGIGFVFFLHNKINLPNMFHLI